MTITRPDLVNLPELTNPTNEQTKFVVQDSGVNQSLDAQRTREFLGNQIGPTGPQGPQGVQGPQGPQGVQGPQGPNFRAYSTSSVTPASFGTIVVVSTSANHAFVTGSRVRAISSITNFFEGIATLSPDNRTFSIEADFNIGATTTDTWTLTLAGQLGATGPQGPQGVQGPTGPSFKVTSVTTATPASTGVITLVVNTSNHAFVTGQRVIAINAVNNFFEGIVTVSGGINFVINADFNIGTTTANSWNIGLSGQRGATGPQGPQGIQGPSGPGMLVTSNSLATPDGITLSSMIVNTNQHSFVQGLRVIAINTNNNFFEGIITNNPIGSTTFVIQQDTYVGGTPATSWTITLTGKEGPQGPQGPINPIATTSTNLAGGQKGQIPIQSAPGITAFVSSGTDGTIFAWTGNTASWVSTSSVRVGTAAVADTVFAENYSTAELSPVKSVGIVDYAGIATPSDVGVQASFVYNTNLEKMDVGRVAVTRNDISTGSTYGALTVAGGVGIAQNLNVGAGTSIAGVTTITNASPSTSPTTGALQVTGGVGIGGDLYVAGDITAQKLTIEYTTVTTTLVQTDDIIRTTNQTSATSTQTGALQVAGGAGIGLDLHVGGTIYGIVVTATNLANGGPGQVPYQVNTGQTGFISIGSTSSVLVSNYTQSPVWQNTLTLLSTVSAVSTVTGAFQVRGGAGIGGDLYVGGTIDGKVTDLAGGATGSIPYQTGADNTLFIPIGSAGTILVSNGSTASWGPAAGIVAGSASTASNIDGGAQFQIPYQVSYGLTQFESGFQYDYITNTFSVTNALFMGLTNSVSTTTGAVQVKGGLAVAQDQVVGGLLRVINTAATTSTTTGALLVTGGVGIGGDLYVGGQIVAQKLVIELTTVSTTLVTTDDIIQTTNATNSTGTTTGALVVGGGAGFALDVFIGGQLTVNGVLKARATTATNLDNGLAGQIPYQTAPGLTSFITRATTGTVLVSRFNQEPIFQNTLTLAGTDPSVSTQTGALTVAGGVGIGGDLYVGGTAVGIITSSTNLFGGLPGSIPYQSATNATSFITRGITGTVLVSRFDKEPVFQNTLTLAGTTSATSTASGAFQVAGGAGIGGDLYVGGTIYGTVTTATNLAGGATGSIPYQDSLGSTKFIPIGLSGQLLVSNGTTATWLPPSGLAAGNASTSSNLAGGAQYQIPYQTAAGATAFEPGFEYRYDTDTFSVTNATIVGTTDSLSTLTGALRVAGGVGIQKNLYVGGGEVVSGIMTITNTTSATNTLTGALQVAGGASFQKDVYIWGSIYATQLVIDVTTVSTNFVVTDDIIQTNNTTNSVSTSTGALIIKGGAGFGRDIYVGGLMYGTATNALLAVTATNVQGGLAGQVLYQSAPGTTAFTGPGVTGTVLVSQGPAGPVFQNTLTLAATTTATSTQSGAFQVRGGAGIGGDLWVGGTIYGLASIVGVITTASNLGGGTAGQVPYQTAPFQTSFYGPGTAGDIVVSRGTTGPTYQNTLTLAGTANATSTNTGALQVVGGAGIGQNLYVGGDVAVAGGDLTSPAATFNLLATVNTITIGTSSATAITIASTSGFTEIRNLVTVSNLTSATSTVTGALQVRGGVGIGGNLYVQQTVKAIGGVNATNTTTGDLQVVGGVGIGRDLYVGGVIYGIASVSGTITTATNVNGGTAGQLLYQSSPGVTSFVTVGATGTVLVSNWTGAPAYQNTLTLEGTTAASSTQSGAFQVRGGAGIGGNVYIGGDLDVAGGDITSNAAAFNLVTTNVTSLGIGQAATTILMGATTGATTVRNNFTLTNTTSATNTQSGAFRVAGGAGIGGDLYVGGTIYGTVAGANVTVVANNAAASHFLTFVDSNNTVASTETFYTTSTIQVTPSSGTLRVNGGSVSTSTLTGALLVTGGVGVGGSMYLNGYLQVGFSAAATYSTGTNGEIRATNEITAYYSSDISLKENIRLITDPITMINQIRGVFFDWTDSYINSRGGEDGFFVRKSDVGVIAQEVEKILPDIVATRENGIKAVRYEKIIPLLIESIKALSTEVENLKKKLN